MTTKNIIVLLLIGIVIGFAACYLIMQSPPAPNTEAQKTIDSLTNKIFQDSIHESATEDQIKILLNGIEK